MKRKWEEPKVIVQKFTPNEYISSCGVLEDGTVLYSANIRIETAWNRGVYYGKNGSSAIIRF